MALGHSAGFEVFFSRLTCFIKIFYLFSWHMPSHWFRINLNETNNKRFGKANAPETWSVGTANPRQFGNCICNTMPPVELVKLRLVGSVMENIPYILYLSALSNENLCHLLSQTSDFENIFQTSKIWVFTFEKRSPPERHLRARAGPHPTPEMLRSGHQMLLSGPMEWTGMEVKSRKSLQIHLKFVRSSQARASTLVTVLWKLKCHHFSSPKLRISEVETKWSVRLHTLCIHISDLQSAPKDGIKRAG